jgi:hypothetical protein
MAGSLFFCPALVVTNDSKELGTAYKGGDMSHQVSLFYEDVNDVLRAMVQALGGAKKVGGAMRGNDVGIEAAHRWILACLNPDRPERFTPEQVLWLLVECRKLNFHAGMHFLNVGAGYAPPTPVDPEDERARLQRDAIDAIRQLEGITKRLEQLGATSPLRSVG